MSWLSDFFKKPKPNLTPNITPMMPGQINPQAYGDLSKLSHNYISGQGTGFGDDYLSRTTNPAIAQIDANFNKRTVPFISNEASKRGLARSSIVQDQLGQADLQRNRDVDSLVAQFFQLNELQKKSDTQFGAQVGQNILTGDVNQQNQQAAQSERLANATAAQQNARSESNDAKLGQITQAVGTLLGGQNIGNLFKGLGQPAQGSALQSFGVQSLAGSQGPKTRLLGDINPNDLSGMNIDELLAFAGG